jgi:hypothetical protein
MVTVGMKRVSVSKPVRILTLRGKYPSCLHVSGKVHEKCKFDTHW